MAAENPIPLYTCLQEVYSDIRTSLNHASRWDALAQEFLERFGRKPAYIARAPGRVNLIGEHIDYALFSVLPAAIECDILIACAPRNETDTDPGTVTLLNMNGRKYAPHTFTPMRCNDLEDLNGKDTWHLNIDTKELKWESYVKAGYCGVLNYYFPQTCTNVPVSADLLVAGTVPAGSGLSSSAALVVASTLAFLAVNGKLGELENLEKGDDRESLNKGKLVEMTMENEKRVGVNSGGMDQAASVMSSPGSALYITFFPELTASPVPLPTSAVFVVANSLVVSDKAVSAKFRYNLRVVETLVAARVLAGNLGLKIGERERITLREVLDRIVTGGERDEQAFMHGLERMAHEVETLKPRQWKEGVAQTGVTLVEMITMSGLHPDAFHEVYMSWVEVEAMHFQLYKRAKHVFAEALRVLQFRKTCLEAASAKGEHQVPLQTLGRLMNESQESCEELFECSCPEIEQLTRLTREAGAFGSRLTGAGWGGCTISLVEEGKVTAFIAQMKDKYPPYRNLDDEKLDEVIFATKPNNGACVYKVE